ncbi:MFS gliotoxin efflux transporter glia [Xylaria arbuscula]|nr:MFS gliotoxin efflux transporter glia [Xylaria arbuscula]
MSSSETHVLPLTPPSDDAVDSTPAEKTEDEGAQAESVAVDDRPHGLRLMVIVAALLLSIFLVALDLTIVATAIPRITDEFHSINDIGWYAAAFFITLGVFQSTWGKAYKHLNLKWGFLLAVFLFEIGSLICAVSQNSTTLIVGRAIAGLGGAGITGGIYIIMAYIVPAAHLPIYIGSIGAVFSVASVAGPLLGGVFTGELTWRWCFYINLPVGGFAFILVILFLHMPKNVQVIPISVRDFLVTIDIPGIALCLGLLVAFTLALQWGGTAMPWSSSRVIGLLVGFGVISIVFSFLQWYMGENAMLVGRVLKQRTIAALSAYIFFLNATNFTLVYNIPQYFQVIKSLSATQSGIYNLPLIIPSAVFSFASGYALSRVGWYSLFLIISAAALAVGAGLVYTLGFDSTLGEIIGYQILVGFGIGGGIQVPVTAAQAFSKPEDIPTVTTVILFFQLVSGAIWVSISQTILNNRLIASLASSAPNISPQQIFQVGATDIRNVFHGADLDHVLKAYLDGLKSAWALSIALAGITFLSGFFAEWKNLRGTKLEPVV